MDEKKIREISHRWSRPTADDVRLLQANVKWMKETRHEMQMMIEQAKITLAALDLVERYGDPEIVVDGDVAYKIHQLPGTNHYDISGVSNDRRAQIYLNAHNERTWGARVDRFGSGPSRDQWLGCRFPTKEDALTQAIRWIVEGVAITDQGETITVDMIDMSYGRITKNAAW